MIETETSKTVSIADGICYDMDDLLENIYIFRDHLIEPYEVSTVATEPAEPAAAACLGVGAYFLAVSLPLLLDYTAAQNAYDVAAYDFDALYDAAEAARTAAIDGNANTNYIIGASLAGAGLY